MLGRRRVFICGVALFGLASLAGGFAADPTLLVVARAVQGIGAALTTPAAVSIITTTFTEGPERNKAVGIYSMMGASGFAVGAGVSGMLTNVLGWRWGFFDHVIIAALVVLLTPILVAVVGIGLSLAFPPMTIAAVTGVQDADQGLASGLVVTGQQLGGALGLALITVVAAAFTPGIAGTHPMAEATNQALVSGFQPALLLAAAFALLGTLIALIGIKERTRKQPEQQMLAGAQAADELPQRRIT